MCLLCAVIIAIGRPSILLRIVQYWCYFVFDILFSVTFSVSLSLTPFRCCFSFFVAAVVMLSMFIVTFGLSRGLVVTVLLSFLLFFFSICCWACAVAHKDEVMNCRFLL